MSNEKYLDLKKDELLDMQKDFTFNNMFKNLQQHKNNVEQQKSRIAEDFLQEVLFIKLIETSKCSLVKEARIDIASLLENSNIYKDYITKRFEEENLKARWDNNYLILKWDKPYDDCNINNKTLYAILVENQRLLELDNNKALKKELQEYVKDILYEKMKNAVCDKDFLNVKLPEKFNSSVCKEYILYLLKSGDIYAEYTNCCTLRIYLSDTYDVIKDVKKAEADSKEALKVEGLVRDVKKVHRFIWVNFLDLSIALTCAVLAIIQVLSEQEVVVVKSTFSMTLTKVSLFVFITMVKRAYFVHCIRQKKVPITDNYIYDVKKKSENIDKLSLLFSVLSSIFIFLLPFALFDSTVVLSFFILVLCVLMATISFYILIKDISLELY